MIKQFWNNIWGRYWRRVQAKSENDPVCSKVWQELNKVGKDFEQRNYNELLKPAEEISFSKNIDGVEIFFSAEAYNIKKNGDICFSIDADTKSPKIKGWKPSYQFCKRKDGTVYYP